MQGKPIDDKMLVKRLLLYNNADEAAFFLVKRDLIFPDTFLLVSTFYTLTGQQLTNKHMCNMLRMFKGIFYVIGSTLSEKSRRYLWIWDARSHIHSLKFL